MVAWIYNGQLGGRPQTILPKKVHFSEIQSRRGRVVHKHGVAIPSVDCTLVITQQPCSYNLISAPLDMLVSPGREVRTPGW